MSRVRLFLSLSLCLMVCASSPSTSPPDQPAYAGPDLGGVVDLTTTTGEWGEALSFGTWADRIIGTSWFVVVDAPWNPVDVRRRLQASDWQLLSAVAVDDAPTIVARQHSSEDEWYVRVVFGATTEVRVWRVDRVEHLAPPPIDLLAPGDVVDEIWSRYTPVGSQSGCELGVVEGEHWVIALGRPLGRRYSEAGALRWMQTHLDILRDAGFEVVSAEAVDKLRVGNFAPGTRLPPPDVMVAVVARLAGASATQDRAHVRLTIDPLEAKVELIVGPRIRETGTGCGRIDPRLGS